MHWYDSDNKQEFLCNSWSRMRLTPAGTPGSIGPTISAPEDDDGGGGGGGDDEDDDDGDDR
jgi:hypothetical protein